MRASGRRSVLICARVERRNFLTRDQRVERLRDVADSNAEIRRPRPVDHDTDFRLAADQSRVGIDDIRNRLHPLEQRVRILRQLL